MQSKKKISVKKQMKNKPNFQAGLSYDIPCFAVDESGRMWWIDPNRQSIKEAKVEVVK